MRPYLRVANVFEDRIDLDDVMEMHFEPHEIPRYELKPGDILLNEGQSRELVGRPAMYRGELPGVCFTNSLIRFQPSPAVVGKFALELFRHWLKSGAFQSRGQITTNIAHLGAGRFAEMDFPLPPVDEQRRIVAKLETLQSHSRRAREALDAVPPLLEKLRQSILAAAFRGDLTKDWRAKHPDVEPASELLKRIRVERRKKWEEAELAKMKAKGKAPKDDSWMAKYDEPRSPDEGSLPELPEGWEWARFEEVATIAANLVDPKKHQDLAHVAPDNIAKGTGELKNVKTVRDDRVISANHRFFPGQVLYSKIRPYLNKCAVAGFDGLCSADMYPIDAHVNAEYLHGYMLSATFLARIQRNAGSRVVLPKANQDQLNAVLVPVAPAAEQDAIAQRIGALQSTCMRTRGLVAQIEERIISFEKSILASAFRGELVPQDPNDEPADVMLARVRSANGVTEEKKKRRARDEART